MKLSKKQTSKLWKKVDDVIMQRRININRKMNEKNLPKEIQQFIDNELYLLGIEAPEAAISLFIQTPASKD